mgnify:FL=1
MKCWGGTLALLLSWSILKATGNQFELPFCHENIPNATICKLEDHYDPFLPPLPWPVLVKPTIFIKEISNVDVEAKSISLFLELFVSWKDSRITVKNQKWRKINPEEANHFWHPTLQFDRILHLEKQSIFGQPKHPFAFWMLTTENTLQYSEEIQVTFTCPMDFSDFPFDVHFCNFTLGDYEYEIEEVEFDWSTVTYSDNSKNILLLKSPEDVIFINDTTTPFKYELSLIKPHVMTDLENEIYSYSGFKIRLERKGRGTLHHSFFIPTAVFAIVSMISFLIHPDSVPGRMGLIVTLLLISSNVYNSVKAPTTRGFSYIDVWIIGSQAPIVFALFQYGFILLIIKYWKTDLDFRTLDFMAILIVATFYTAFNWYFW